MLTLTSREDIDADLGAGMYQDVLGRAVGAFDALGKKLRELRPDVFPPTPRNIFQNFDALDKALANKTRTGIAGRIGTNEADELNRLLQVRHLFEHNLGVVDQPFVRRVPSQAHLIGRKYPLNQQDVDRAILLLGALANSIQTDMFQSSKVKQP